MSRIYKFYNPQGLYFVSFATINWIDIFTRPLYKDILVENLNYCIKNKGLIIYAWVIMTNHVHLIIRTRKEPLQDIMRDFKGYTSKKILKMIKENPHESRKEWMLSLFSNAGQKNPNNKSFQLWRQDNKPMELEAKSFDVDHTIEYIHNNPVKMGFVIKPEDYLYSSAVDYAGGKGFVYIEMAG